VGARLLEERDATFIAWIYGRVHDAAEALRARQTASETPEPHGVRRLRRLPVVSAPNF
jgi:hypothetical protein